MSENLSGQVHSESCLSKLMTSALNTAYEQLGIMCSPSFCLYLSPSYLMALNDTCVHIHFVVPKNIHTNVNGHTLSSR